MTDSKDGIGKIKINLEYLVTIENNELLKKKNEICPKNAGTNLEKAKLE